MKTTLSVLTRYMPLLLTTTLLMSAIATAMQLGLTASAIDTFLARLSPVYGVLAAACWVIVAVGLLYESRKKSSKMRSKGLIMDILNRLTNREALERMMDGQDQAVIIDAADLAMKLKARVIGQDAVCDDLSAQIRRRLALSRRGKPVGVFLAAGPPGTGKTYLSSRLAAELDRRLLQFDMTQFSSPHVATQLFGSPKGYTGSDTYGKLTAALRETPDCVVLLDEIEKAHPDVHKKFLTAWNDGYVTEASDGKQIDTTRAIFMLTSNAATDELTALAVRFKEEPDELRRTSIEALRGAGFAPEVLNRLDRIFVFVPLAGLDVARVTALEIERMINSYELAVAPGGIDAELLFAMMQRQQRLGAVASARDLARGIEEAIADSLISAKQAHAKTVALAMHDGRVVAEVVA
ncbi:MAG: AAA family ATPase [Rhodopila sp.]|nr:AAA family ATPase [Rhodopila sp.]